MMLGKIKKRKNVQKTFNKKNLNLKIVKIVYKHISLKKKCPEKYKIHVESLIEDHKKFVGNNKIILKSQQRFKSKRHNFFMQEIYDKKLESIGSVET